MTEDRQNMRGLLIAGRLLAKNSGVRQLTEAYCYCLKEIVGEQNFDVIAIKEESEETNNNYICMSRKVDPFSIMMGYSTFINRHVIRKVNEIIDRGMYDFVFFAEPVYGKYIKEIKKRRPDLLIITLYHGINAYQRIKSSYKLNVKKNLDDWLNGHNQKIANKISDVRILLNERDNENLYKFYGVKATDIIPIFIKDCYIDGNLKDHVMDQNNFNLLFVGVYMIHNVNGIEWFIENVIPKLDSNIHLYVVGSGIERILNEIHCLANVHVLGRVDDLSAYYKDADLVIEPIFGGDGMKVKTTEALMYGKHILASQEALCGYDKNAGLLCQTAADYVNAIEEYSETGIDKFSIVKRQLYVDNYSMTATKAKLIKIFERYHLE